CPSHPLTGTSPVIGALISLRPADFVQIDAFAPARPDHPAIASFLYEIHAGQVVERPLPNGQYFAPRALAEGLCAQAVAAGVNPADVLLAIEVSWCKVAFFALGLEPAGSLAGLREAALQ